MGCCFFVYFSPSTLLGRKFFARGGPDHGRPFFSFVLVRDYVLLRCTLELGHCRWHAPPAASFFFVFLSSSGWFPLLCASAGPLTPPLLALLAGWFRVSLECFDCAPFSMTGFFLVLCLAIARFFPLFKFFLGLLLVPSERCFATPLLSTVRTFFEINVCLLTIPKTRPEFPLVHSETSYYLFVPRCFFLSGALC